MKEKNIKRGYNYPEELLEEWEKFHFPSKDYSPSAAGAMFVFMLLPSDVREKARKLAQRRDLDAAKKEFVEYFNQAAQADRVASETLKAVLGVAEKTQQGKGDSS